MERRKSSPESKQSELKLLNHEQLWVLMRRLLREQGFLRDALRDADLPEAKLPPRRVEVSHDELFTTLIEDQRSVIENIFKQSAEDQFKGEAEADHEPVIEAHWNELDLTEASFRALLATYPPRWIKRFSRISIEPHLSIPKHQHLAGSHIPHIQILHEEDGNLLSLDQAYFSNEASLHELLTRELPFCGSRTSVSHREQSVPLDQAIQQRFLKTAILLDHVWGIDHPANFDPTQLKEDGDRYENELIALAFNVSVAKGQSWSEAVSRELQDVYNYTPSQALMHLRVLEELWKNHDDVSLEKRFQKVRAGEQQLTSDRSDLRDQRFLEALPDEEWKLFFEEARTVNKHAPAIQRGMQNRLTVENIPPHLARLLHTWLQEQGDDVDLMKVRMEALERWKGDWTKQKPEERHRELRSVRNQWRRQSSASSH